MKFTKKIKKMNGVVARGYFYEELSWSHINTVPYAPILISGYFGQLVLRAGFWKALVTFLD